ncbi:MAG: DUF805 domain-containing protein [Myxococcales bacterium]
MQCTQCGSQVVEGSTACPACGKPLAASAPGGALAATASSNPTDIMTAVKSAFSNYANFEGRTSRAGYWWFFLFLSIVDVVLRLISFALLGIWGLAIMLPAFAVGVRRLHDIDKSGWHVLSAFVPVLGWLYLLYLTVQPGTPGPNRFGNGTVA